MPTKDAVQKRKEKVAIFLSILGKTGVLEKIEGSGSNYILNVEGASFIVERMLDNQHIMALVALVEELPENELSVGFLIEFTNLAGVHSIFRSRDIVGYPIKQVTHDFFARLGSVKEKQKFEIDFKKAEEVIMEAGEKMKAIVAEQMVRVQDLQAENDKLKALALRLTNAKREKMSLYSKIQALTEFKLAYEQMKVTFGEEFVHMHASFPSLTDLQSQDSILASEINVLQQQNADAQILVSKAVLAKKRADDAFSAASKENEDAKKRMDGIVRSFNRSKLGLGLE